MPSWLEQQTDSLATIDGVQRHRTTNITPENIYVYFCSERSEAYFCIKRSAKSHLSGCGLDIDLAMPQRSVASAPNILIVIFKYFCSKRSVFCIKNNRVLKGTIVSM